MEQLFMYQVCELPEPKISKPMPMPPTLPPLLK
jgi:hypothetical protein